MGVYKVDASSNELSNRAEAIVEIGKILGLDGTQRATKFKDVPKNHYASGYIQSAVDKGIVTGYKDGTFKPNASLTRAHVAIFISRAFGSKLPSSDVSFRDVKSSNSAYSAIQQLVAAGITSGYPDGTFKPTNKLTKTHLKTFISRTDNYLKTGEKQTKTNQANNTSNKPSGQDLSTTKPTIPDPNEDYEAYLKAIGVDMNPPPMKETDIRDTSNPNVEIAPEYLVR